jgi:hypothetical protein
MMTMRCGTAATAHGPPWWRLVVMLCSESAKAAPAAMLLVRRCVPRLTLWWPTRPPASMTLTCGRTAANLGGPLLQAPLVEARMGFLPTGVLLRRGSLRPVLRRRRRLRLVQLVTAHATTACGGELRARWRRRSVPLRRRRAGMLVSHWIRPPRAVRPASGGASQRSQAPAERPWARLLRSVTISAAAAHVKSGSSTLRAPSTRGPPNVK